MTTLDPARAATADAPAGPAAPAAPAAPARRRGARPPRIVAHRGASRIRREDTLPAVAVAAAMGAHAVEVDVRRTSDGVAVLLHDATLGRLWGDGRRVSDVPWCDVARLGNGLDRIPRLDDVLDRLGGTGTGLVVSVDDPADGAVAITTVLASGADVPVAWRGAIDALAAVRAASASAVLWMPWDALAPPAARDLVALAPAAIDVDPAFLTAGTVRAAHALGLTVSCGVVDEPALGTWVARLGVDTVSTTDVLTLRAVVGRALLEDRGPMPHESAEAEIAPRAQALAHRIAHEVIAFTREHSAVVTPGVRSTRADPDLERRIERLVRGRVREVFPTHGFTGDGYGAAPGDRNRWWLDAVDGTANLAAGVPWTSMSLGLTRAGRPVVGVVADPWRGEVFEARRGHGAVIRDRALVLGDRPAALAGAVVGTELDDGRAWPGFVPFLEALSDRRCALRVFGSGALTLAQVAAGRGIGACVAAYRPIEHAAAVLLVHEAGGVVCTPDGPVDALPPEGDPLLVAHPGAVDELFALWCSARSQ